MATTLTCRGPMRPPSCSATQPLAQPAMRPSPDRRLPGRLQGSQLAADPDQWNSAGYIGRRLDVEWRLRHMSAADLNQNVPNALYNTESGLEYPSAPRTGKRIRTSIPLLARPAVHGRAAWHSLTAMGSVRLVPLRRVPGLLSSFRTFRPAAIRAFRFNWSSNPVLATTIPVSRYWFAAPMPMARVERRGAAHSYWRHPRHQPGSDQWIDNL